MKIFLIPELMQMTGLTDDMRKNRYLMTAISQYTKIEPKERMNEIN